MKLKLLSIVMKASLFKKKKEIILPKWLHPEDVVDSTPVF